MKGRMEGKKGIERKDERKNVGKEGRGLNVETEEWTLERQKDIRRKKGH